MGEEVEEHWKNNENVAIIDFLDDVNQPYTCAQWGSVGNPNLPIIIDDKDYNFHNEFYENYSPEVINNIDKIPCMYYLHKQNPLMRNCSHFVQREIMNMYTKNNNLIADGKHFSEECEIYGLNHYPVIFHYLTSRKINDIVMASILCLPKDVKLRTKVLSSAKKNNVNLHFSLENKVSSDFSADDANSYYQLLLEADKLL